MANKNQVIGRGKIKVDGAIVDTAGDITFDPGGVTREPVTGDYDAGSFRVSGTRPAKLEVAILTKLGFSATDWANIDNSTVSVEFDTGEAWVMRNAYSEGAPSITTSDGKAKAVAYSQPAERVS